MRECFGGPLDGQWFLWPFPPNYVPGIVTRPRIGRSRVLLWRPKRDKQSE